MGHASDFKVEGVSVTTEPLTFRAPLKFGGRVVAHYQVVNVRIDVSTRAGKRGTGFGSMPIGHIWAWPTQTLEPALTEEAMKQLSFAAGRSAESLSEYADPLEHGTQLDQQLAELATNVMNEAGLTESMPRLAQLVAASPIDAALHDAFGQVNQANSYNLLGPDALNRDLSAYLGPLFKGEYLDRYTLRTPKPTMPLYHLVGALDPLTPADIAKPIGDGLPETLGDWINDNGLTHLKIKLAGDNLDWDVERVAAVETVSAQAQHARGQQTWNYSLDFNERCSSVDYVLEFLARVRERAPAALDRVQYIEQPTHRDLKTRGTSMAAAAKIKPIVIDESLVDYESLLLARELGYTGVALKACKGQTESLLMAAAAQKHEMFLCVQDLTCPGASFLHSAGLAARVVGVAAIEGNSRQYCPEGNVGWAKLFPGLFTITQGSVETSALVGNGLGHFASSP